MSMFKKDGEQLVLRATGEAVRLFVVENFGFAHYPNGEMLKFIDSIAHSGGNAVRVFGFFPFGRGREEEPYVRAGRKFDLDRVNLTFVNYLRQWVEYAERQGVAVWYELFDSVGLKYSRLAPYHPFGEFNDGDLRAFSDLSNHRMVSYQKKYLEEIVNVLKQFPNVIFALINEFAGEENWHIEMSQYVKALAPQHLLAASAHDSPAIDDPNVDICAIHTASYDRGRCQSNLAHDLQEWRPKFRGKITAYSTDGFGLKGMPCENPDAMRDLAQDARRHNLSVLSFLDHNPYVDFDEAGTEYSVGTWYRDENVYELSHAGRANVATYQAIAQTFEPTRFAEPAPLELPEGMLYAFDANYLESSHPHVLSEKGGKAVAATTTQGYLCRTQQIPGLPNKPLNACFSVFIDNNTHDDTLVLIVDVWDAAKQEVLAVKSLTRKKFPAAQRFTLITLPFTPPENAAVELRVYYFGFAYVAVDKLAIADPEKYHPKYPTDIPNMHSSTSSPSFLESVLNSTKPTPTPAEPEKSGLVGLFDVADLHCNHPEAFPDKGGRAVRATTQAGFLAFGQYVTGYPAKRLDVYFSLFIDNNTADNSRIITLDVYDSAQNKLLAQVGLTRRQFPAAGAFSLFKLSFTPAAQSKLEFRIYYHGWSYIAADKIAVVDPDNNLQLKTHDDILALGTTPVIPEPGPSPVIPPGDAFVVESLKDGKTTGRVENASFTSEGLQLHGGEGFLSYTIPSAPRGFVEFNAQGFVHDELHGGSEYKGVLVTMWDEDAGYSYEAAPFIFELRKYGYIEGRRDASNTLWFKIKSNGEWTENHRTVLSWDPNRTYRFRLEWGGGTTRVLRDGQETATGTYRAEFAPPRHKIQIGANLFRGRKCPHNIVISDIVIGKA